MSPAPPAAPNKSHGAVASGGQSYAVSGEKSTSKMAQMDRDRMGVWGSGDGQSNSRISGLDRLKHPGLNKVSCVLLGHGCSDAEVLSQFANRISMGQHLMFVRSVIYALCVLL